MLMRGFVVLLLLLNAAALAWQWELFAPWGWAPQSAREPERVLNQIRPETIRIETPAVAAKRWADEAAQAEKLASDATATTTATGPATASAEANSASALAPTTPSNPKTGTPSAPINASALKPPATVPADNASKPAKVTSP
jgi:hypothetical protein